jgi:hypothetical protein
MSTRFPCRLMYRPHGSKKSPEAYSASLNSMTANSNLWSINFICMEIQWISHLPLTQNNWIIDRLCGLVVRVHGYRPRDPGFDYRSYQIFLEVVDLERDPLSLVSITEELLEWKSSGSGSRKPRLTGVGIRSADHVTPSIPKSWQ